MNILVSINCITYNHEKYIAEAIESFLMQKTNFGFEILIHDDASTDRTSDIIMEYEKRYPDIIKPIFQKENQLSLGIKGISYKYNHKRAIGKYIAMCEGDDCWADPYKLQKQVDYMEEDPDCTFCFHNAFVIDENHINSNRLVIPWMLENRDYFGNGESRRYSAGELQLLGFIPTASFIFPKYVLDNPPEWYFESPVGDNPLKLIASSFGNAYYMKEPMCFYRFNVPNSATTKWKKGSKDKEIELCKKFVMMLDNFNKWSNFKYDKEIDEAKKTWEFQLAISKNTMDFKNDRYTKHYNYLSKNYKLKLHIRYYLPKIYTGLSNLKDILKKNYYIKNNMGEIECKSKFH